MTRSQPKINLSSSRDIPLDKLVLSQSNVRRIKAGVCIEELAEDIARRTLLQSLTVRPVLDAEGRETGLYEVPAGGRRFRALELLVRQKRLAKGAPIPCVIRTEGIAEEDSLAENVQRAPLHPLDQFRALAPRPQSAERGRSAPALYPRASSGVAAAPRRSAMTKAPRLLVLSLQASAIFALAGAAYVHPRLLWNATASAPIGLYAVQPNPRPNIGDLVVVRPDPALARWMVERRYIGRDVPLVKRVQSEILAAWDETQEGAENLIMLLRAVRRLRRHAGSPK